MMIAMIRTTMVVTILVVHTRALVNVVIIIMTSILHHRSVTSPCSHHWHRWHWWRIGPSGAREWFLSRCAWPPSLTSLSARSCALPIDHNTLPVSCTKLSLINCTLQIPSTNNGHDPYYMWKNVLPRLTHFTYDRVMFTDCHHGHMFPEVYRSGYYDALPGIRCFTCVSSRYMLMPFN